jgi:hypothetical protein
MTDWHIAEDVSDRERNCTYTCMCLHRDQDQSWHRMFPGDMFPGGQQWSKRFWRELTYCKEISHWRSKACQRHLREKDEQRENNDGIFPFYYSPVRSSWVDADRLVGETRNVKQDNAHNFSWTSMESNLTIWTNSSFFAHPPTRGKRRRLIRYTAGAEHMANPKLDFRG